MSKRDHILLIQDMLDSAIRVKDHTHGQNFNDFIKDNKTIDAVVRNFEIIVQRQTEWILILKQYIHKFIRTD